MVQYLGLYLNPAGEEGMCVQQIETKVLENVSYSQSSNNDT